MAFVYIGRIVARGEGDGFIAGYNTASKQEQEKYDIVRIRKFISRTMYAVAVLLIPLCALPFLPECYIAIVILTQFAAMIALIVFMLMRSDKWLKKK